MMVDDDQIDIDNGIDNGIADDDQQQNHGVDNIFDDHHHACRGRCRSTYFSFVLRQYKRYSDKPTRLDSLVPFHAFTHSFYYQSTSTQSLTDTSRGGAGRYGLVWFGLVWANTKFENK